jgi:hypothetical protein
MDLLDLLIYAPGRSRESHKEEAAKGLVLFLIPMLDAGILMATELYRSLGLSLVVFPLLCAAAGSLIVRRMAIEPGYARRLVLGCWLWCFGVAAGLLVIDVMIFPF